jgi:hypothetical protein
MQMNWHVRLNIELVLLYSGATLTASEAILINPFASLAIDLISVATTLLCITREFIR